MIRQLSKPRIGGLKCLPNLTKRNPQIEKITQGSPSSVNIIHAGCAVEMVTDIPILQLLQRDQVGPANDPGELEWARLLPPESLACGEGQGKVELGSAEV
nr:hypothetical protein Itr_chr13CG09280 [Ipomoea trifida]